MGRRVSTGSVSDRVCLCYTSSQSVRARRYPVAHAPGTDLCARRRCALVLPFGLLPSRLLLDVEPVQEAVGDGRDDDAGDGDEGEAAEERVEGGEDLAGVVLEVADRPHARKDHRGVQQRVNPREAREVVVADDARAQREGDDGEGEREVARDAPEEG